MNNERKIDYNFGKPLAQASNLNMTESVISEQEQIEELEIDLERDLFMRNLIRELSGILEDVVGIDEASGFISVVGQNMGNQINGLYRNALMVDSLDKEQVKATLVNLKKRIKGDFYIISEDDDKVVLGNRACPFAKKVLNRESLCMMTSNVFGVIAAENLGYGKVALEKTIAAGDPECRITVYFSDPGDSVKGREYFKSQ